jgi:glycolate oxidase iron-sulfur subunit
MQPDISEALKARKVKNIEATKPDVIATGNIGCITQIASGTPIPIVHTVQLLNWAYGGNIPEKLRDLPLG